MQYLRPGAGASRWGCPFHFRAKRDHWTFTASLNPDIGVLFNLSGSKQDSIEGRVAELVLD